MGLLGGMSGHLEGKTKLRSKSDASMMKPENGASGESTYDTTNLDKEEGNILMSIISQCGFGFLLLRGGPLWPAVAGDCRGGGAKRQPESRLTTSTARYGFEQDCLADVCPRAAVVVGAHHRFLLSPRTHLWVRIRSIPCFRWAGFARPPPAMHA